MQAERKQVLVVENEALVRLYLGEILSEAGLFVVEAADGDVAVLLLDQIDALDLLLTDIQMPGSTCGNKVAEAAKLRHPGLAVVYASGRPDSLVNRLGPRDRFLQKPFAEGEPMGCVMSLLRIDKAFSGEQ